MHKRRVLAAAVLLVSVAVIAAGEEQVTYYAVFADGKKIGHWVQTRKVSGGKVTTVGAMRLSVLRGGVPIDMAVVATEVETAAGRPLGFKVVQQVGAAEQVVEAEVKDGQVIAKVRAAGAVRPMRLPWPQGALMSEGALLLKKKKGLSEGATYQYRSFELSSMAAGQRRVRVGARRQVDLLGRVVALTEVETVHESPTGAVTATEYVDEDLQVQKGFMPLAGMRIELVACNKGFALGKNDVVDFFEKLVVTSPISLAEANRARSIAYHLSPASGAVLRIPSTDSQTVRGGKGKAKIVVVRRLTAKAGATFLYQSKDEAALAALKPSRYVQSDAKVIAGLARKAVGETTDAAEAVRRIEQFVYAYIDKKDLSVGYATALEVAQSRRGDCTEHAVLAAALCRAAGIPARVVMGIAYVGDFRGRKNVFLPHAWVEVCVEGKWVPLDAALGRWDPRRIALASGDGDPADFFGMVSTLGYFRIEKVVVEK